MGIDGLPEKANLTYPIGKIYLDATYAVVYYMCSPNISSAFQDFTGKSDTQFHWESLENVRKHTRSSYTSQVR